MGKNNQGSGVVVSKSVGGKTVHAREFVVTDSADQIATTLKPEFNNAVKYNSKLDEKVIQVYIFFKKLIDKGTNIQQSDIITLKRFFQTAVEFLERTKDTYNLIPLLKNIGNRITNLSKRKGGRTIFSKQDFQEDYERIKNRFSDIIPEITNR